MWKTSILGGAILISLTASAAEPPEFYKEVSGAVWVVKNIAAPLAAWQAVGLENIRRDGNFASGQFGSFSVEMLQPGADDPVLEGFLKRHGNGVFAVLHTVPDPQALERESERLAGLGVRVLRTSKMDGRQYTFFDTEARGKYVLGLVCGRRPQTPAARAKLTHLGLVVHDVAPVSAFWHWIGFPEMGRAEATPREDSRYRGKPLWFAFGVGWDNHSKPTLEWIIPPLQPANWYADYLRAHGEGVQHLGIPVDNLDDAVARYGKLGYSPAQTGAWGDVGKPNSGRYAYMDTEVLSVSMELIQAYK